MPSPSLATTSRSTHAQVTAWNVKPDDRAFACREETKRYGPAPIAGSAAGLPGPVLRRFPGQQQGSQIAAYRMERSIRQADGLAISLRAGLERIAVPLARATGAFVRKETWFAFGFARLEDHARERFGRSGRWVKDCGSLGRALEALPLLADALTGDDGGRPIGRVAALLIGRVACPASLGAWVALARSVTVRALRGDVAAARAAGSQWPEGSVDAPDRAPLAEGSNLLENLGAEDVLSERSLVRISTPAPVLAAFDEAVELYRAVEGAEATITSFVEALVAEESSGVEGLVAEASSGCAPPDADRSPMSRAAAVSAVESALARSTDNWRDLPATSPASWAMALAGVTLTRLREVERTAGSGGAADLDSQIRALIALENDMQSRLGRLLTEMGERGAWARLRFAGVGHYAEERLGLSRTYAEDRARAARALRHFPFVRAAYEDGRIGLEVTLLIIRLLGGAPVEPDVERAWVARAEEATVKRLRDETRALGRRGSGRVPRGALPQDDASWHASLRRGPRTARDRVLRFGLQAARNPNPDVFLRLRLPHDLAGDFLAAVEGRRGTLSAEVDSIPWDEPWPDATAPPSLLAARMFSVRCRRVPAWIGLLALLEEFVATWDATVGRPGDAIYVRDGWRCTAPGCTSRRNLEDHHIVYRSREGSDNPANRACLCRFHHQRGEHGDLASCSGTAPLGLLWRLGRTGLGVWYRNEKRLASAAPAP
jgi:hypothetical protein